TWEDLVREGRALIPALAADWTDYNVSDPGITLIELFAAITEAFVYQTNRITPKHFLAYAKLLGAVDNPEQNPGDAASLALRALSQIRRAVTKQDFESLARSVDGVEQVYCLPNRRLKRSSLDTLLVDAPGFVLVLILAKSESPADIITR